MATVKITQLPPISGASADATDVLPLVDVSSNITNKITRQEFFNNIPSATFSGDLTISDKIVHSGDTNTSIRFPADDTVTVETGGSERMRIDSSGNVGIGTSSPAVKLDVSGGGSVIRVIEPSTGSGSNVYFRAEDRRTAVSGSFQSGYQFADFAGVAAEILLDHNGFLGTRNLLFNVAGTERMRIDSSGNLGLGVTPSAWGVRALEIAGPAFIGSSSPAITLSTNGVFSGSAWSYKTTAAASAYGQNTGGHYWYTAPSGTAGNPITFTQAMTLDASGNLAVGTTATLTKLTLGATTSAGTVAATPSIVLTNRDQTNASFVHSGIFAETCRDVAYPHYSAGIWFTRTPQVGNASSSSDIVFGAMNTNETGSLPTERMRITASGNLLVGKTAADTPTTADGFELLGSSAAAFCTVNTSGAANTWHLYNRNATNNGYRFYVKVDGGVVNFSANNTNLSDERVKTDIAPVGSYWDKIKALQVVTYKYKDQSHDDDNIGVIAQQVESVAPEFVSNDGFGETPEDGVPLKSIYEADLHYATLKALQEAMARIEVLEARIAALET